MNTTIRPNNFLEARSHIMRRLIQGCVLGLAVATLTTPAQAGFHLWSIREVYTDVGGTLQFIELATGSGGQSFVGGQSISVFNIGASQTHTFTLPAGSLAGSTANKALLFGTAGLQAAGGPTPDYIIPNNFLFSAGGSISFFGSNSGAYSALPTDGVLSRTWTGGNASNTPQNYAGTTGFVAVPEPAALALLGLGFGLLLNLRRQQR